MNKNALVLVFLGIIFFIALIVNENISSIYSAGANYYFKKGEISKAQSYYEKAFDLGLYKNSDRDIYVKSLITAPLTTKSLEKMVAFLSYPVEDNAKFTIANFLYEMKREIHRKYPENYITQTVYNQKVMRWSKVPVTYSFERIDGVPNYFYNEIENAFDAWERATDKVIIFNEDRENPNIKIKFNFHNPADNEEQKYVVAYTLPTIIGDELQSMTIEFYLKNPSEEFFTKNQVYNTALHEIAHALGFMGHSNNRHNVMYLTKDSMDVYYDVRDKLTQADINTILLLYEIKPDISDNLAIESKYVPYIVLGDNLDRSIAKTREAKIYINTAPELPSGHIDLAESYVTQGQYGKAIKSLQKALQLADTDEIKNIVYFNLAVCHLSIEDFLMAEDYIKEALKIKESEDARFVLAEIYYKKKDYINAEKEYLKLIAQNPKNINYTIALTNIYVLDKKFIKARQVLKSYSKANPADKNNPRFQSYGFLRFGL